MEKDQPINHGDSSANPNQERPGQPTHDATIPIQLKQNPPETAYEHPQTKQKENKISCWEKATTVILGVTLLAAGVAAYFTYCLAVSTRELVYDGRENAQRQIRAYVFAKPYSWVNTINGTGVHTDIILRNGGSTPASDLKLHGALSARNAPPENRAAFFETTTQMVDSGRSDTVLDPSAEPTTAPRLAPKTPLTPDEIAAVREGTQNVFVWGVVAYKDVFGEDRRSYFCFVYSGITNSSDGGMGSKFTRYCDHPNPN